MTLNRGGSHVRVSAPAGALTGVVAGVAGDRPDARGERAGASGLWGASGRQGAAGDVARFDGVRYGDRPVGPAGRFAPAEPPHPDRAQDATPAVFPQQPGGLDWLLGPAMGEERQDERAHLLSIWAPADALGDATARLPVIVYLPGGGFMSGGPSRWYDGERLAREGRAVVVTVAYRLGAIGLLGGDSPTNLPVADVLLALRWVGDNIAAFGGDPGAVTLVGESAGAWLAWLVSQEPSARGLVARTTLVSLPFEPPMDAAGRAARVAVVAEALAAGGETLETAPLDAVLAAQRALAKAFAGKGLAVMPQVGPFVPADLADAAAVAPRLHVGALLLLTSTDEGIAFIGPAPEQAFPPEAPRGFVRGAFADGAVADVDAAIDARLAAAGDARSGADAGRSAHADAGTTPKARLAAAMTLQQFELMQREVADAATAAGIPAYAVSFDVPTGIPGVGAAHSSVLPYLFGNRDGWRDAPMLSGVPSDAFDVASGELRAMLLGFARDAAPRQENGAPIERYDPAHPEVVAVTPAGLQSRPACAPFERCVR